METITFRCRTCQMVLKVGADKAGRTAKCSKCGTPLTIPSKSEAAAPVPSQAPKPATKDSDDEGDGAYSLQETTSAEQARPDLEQRPKAPALKGPGRKKTKKQAKITNPEAWRKVGVGSRIIAVGLCICLAANVLHFVPIVMGLVAGKEYAAAADERLLGQGNAANLNVLSYAVALVAGNSRADTALLLLRISQFVHILQWLVLIVGYVICMAAPNDHGIRLQLLVLIGLAVVNAGCLIGFKLLPMLGVHSYVLLPFVFPEVAMADMNADRQVSILIFWLKNPMIEVFATVVLNALLFLEPAMIATFLNAVGKSVRSERIEAASDTAMMFGYSQLFIQTSWLMVAICGSSSVLLWLLRIVYSVGLVFFVYQIYITATALFGVPAVIEEQLGDEGAATEGDEESEEKDEDEEEQEDEEEE